MRVWLFLPSRTPLLVACLQGHVDAARLLLDNGAEVDPATKKGTTPLAIAEERGHSSIVAPGRALGAGGRDVGTPKYDYARNMSGRYASPPETRDHSLGRPRADASLRGVNADRGL